MLTRRKVVNEEPTEIEKDSKEKIPEENRYVINNDGDIIQNKNNIEEPKKTKFFNSKAKKTFKTDTVKLEKKKENFEEKTKIKENIEKEIKPKKENQKEERKKPKEKFKNENNPYKKLGIRFDFERKFRKKYYPNKKTKFKQLFFVP